MNKYLNLINPTAEDIKVIGRIVSVANDGVVASAYQIWDDYLHMWQGEINKLAYEYSMKHEKDIEHIYEQLDGITIGGISDIILNGIRMRNGSDVIVDLGTVIRDLSNYYAKSETYNKEEIQDLINRIPKMTIIKVDVLPEDPSQYVEDIVLVPASPGEESNYYDEYIVSVSETEMPDGHSRLNYMWEKIGSTKVDLSNYATKEDWPGTEHELFEATQEIWNTWLDSKNTPRSWVCLDNNGKVPASLLPNLNDEYTLTKNGTSIELKKNGSTVSSVVDSNTTYSIMTSAQISAGTSTTGHVISAKVLKDELDKKVDAEEGKGLSTNDYTNAEKEAVQQAVEQASNVNVELEGSVITVTNKEGVEKEIDLQNATDERVFINCSTTVEGTSVSGLSINVYYGDILHTTLTTNAQGSARIDIPNGTTYKIVFPRLAGCNPIPDVKHTAVMSQRSVEAVYVEEFIAYEHVKFNVKKADTISDVQPFEGVEVKVEYGEHIEHYISDAQGVIEFEIPIGDTYAYTVVRPDGYYMYEGRSVFTKLASSALFEATIKLVPYETGIFIITNNGGHYTFDQYKTAVEGGLERIEDAMLIKISTELLNSNNSPFCISIDETVEGYSGIGSMIIRNGQVLPMSENSAFNGYINSTYIAGNSSGFVPPVVSMCLEKTITIGSLTAHGFLGSIQQLSALINLRSQIDDIIDYTRPTTTGRLSDLLGVKWSSTRNNNTTVATYSSSLGQSGVSVAGSLINQYFITFYTI